MKELAVWVECVHEGGAYTDHCFICAPWWGKYPKCPKHHVKLAKSGYCKKCHKYYVVSTFEAMFSKEAKLVWGGV